MLLDTFLRVLRSLRPGGVIDVVQDVIFIAVVFLVFHVRVATMNGRDGEVSASLRCTHHLPSVWTSLLIIFMTLFSPDSLVNELSELVVTELRAGHHGGRFISTNTRVVRRVHAFPRHALVSAVALNNLCAGLGRIQITTAPLSACRVDAQTAHSCTSTSWRLCCVTRSPARRAQSYPRHPFSPPPCYCFSSLQNPGASYLVFSVFLPPQRHASA